MVELKDILSLVLGFIIATIVCKLADHCSKSKFLALKNTSSLPPPEYLSPFKLTYTLPNVINEEPASKEELLTAWKKIQAELDVGKVIAENKGYLKGHCPKAYIAVRREVATELKVLLEKDNSDVLTKICSWNTEDDFNPKERCFMRNLVVAFDQATLDKCVYDVTDW